MDRRVSITLHMMVPVIFLVLAGAFVGRADETVFEPPLLLPFLNTLLAAALPLAIAVLALRSYVILRARIFVLLGCGLVAPAAGSLVAAWGLAAHGGGFAVAVHNVGALLGGMFHLAAAVLLFRGAPAPSAPAGRRALAWGGLAYGGAAALVVLAAVLSARDVLPAFFLPGRGPTLTRQVVVSVAAASCAFSAILLIGIHARTGMTFFSMYANGLLLTAVGLAAVIAETNTGGLLGWTGRAAQYAGNIYFVLALTRGRSETRFRGTSLPAYLSELLRSRVDQEVHDRTRSLQEVNRLLQAEVDTRRRAEDELRRSEERLREAASATGFGVFAFDHETGEVYSSPELLAILGLPADGRIPLDDDWVLRQVHPDDLGAVRGAVSDALALRGSGILDAEFRIVRPNGEIRWVRARSKTSRGPGPTPGTYLNTHGIMQDITERKFVEGRVRESEAMYRSILDQSLQGIAIIQDGRFVLCNDTLCRMSGYSREECYGMTPVEVQATIHPADRPRAVEGMRGVLETGTAGPPEVFRFLSKQGETHWTTVLATRTTFGGRPAVQVSYLDVTARKRAEEAYRTLVDSAQDGLAIVRGGRTLFANQALERITGYSTGELARMTPEENLAMVHPEDRGKFARSAPQGVAYSGPPGILGFRIRHKDGAWRDLETRMHPVEYEGAPALQVTYRDVTDVKAAQDALNETHRKMRNLAAHLLRAREEERRKVAQEVHDELGQILAALKMDLHWLKKRVKGTSEAVDRKLDGMIGLGEQTIGVVQRISSELRPKMLDDLGLAPALDWLAADFQRRVKVSCSVQVQIPAGMIGGNTATVLYRVVQEALSNVARHSLARSARILVQRSDGFIELRVEDDGIGITPSQGGAADAFGIIGMHERVEGIGGTVLVAGEPGRGTTVTARIPLPAEGGLA